jgi:hypothetical protein
VKPRRGSLCALRWHRWTKSVLKLYPHELSGVFPFYVSVPAKLVTEQNWKQIGKTPPLIINMLPILITPTCRAWLKSIVGAQSVDWILASFSWHYDNDEYYANFYFADKTKAALFAVFWM